MQNEAVLKKFIFQLTPYCNGNCVFCMNGGSQRGKKLDFDEYKRVILGLVNNQKSNIKLETCAFTGGEPLLEKELLLRVAEFNKAQGIRTMLVSNAMLVTSELAEQLFKAGITIARVSLDAFEEKKYDELRGTKNGLQQAIKGIRALVAQGMFVIVRCTIGKYDLDQVVGAYELAASLGVNEFQARIVSPFGKASASFFPSIEEVETVFNSLFERENGLKITTPCFFFGPCTPAKVTNRMQACPCAREWVYVRHDGEMWPCNYFPPAARIGNFYKDNIGEIWNNSPILKEIRTTKPDKCKKCENWSNCLNQCQGLVYSFTKGFKTTCFEAVQAKCAN